MVVMSSVSATETPPFIWNGVHVVDGGHGRWVGELVENVKVTLSVIDHLWGSYFCRRRLCGRSAAAFLVGRTRSSVLSPQCTWTCPMNLVLIVAKCVHAVAVARVHTILG